MALIFQSCTGVHLLMGLTRDWPQQGLRENHSSSPVEKRGRGKQTGGEDQARRSQRGVPSNKEHTKRKAGLISPSLATFS